MGFFATRWVEAATADEAELKAVDLIRNDPTFADMRPGAAKPMIYVREIEALGGAPDTPPGKGYAFFEMSTG